MQIETRIIIIICVHKTHIKYFQFLIKNIELYFYTKSSQNNSELSRNTDGLSKCVLPPPVYTSPLIRFALQREVLP